MHLTALDVTCCHVHTIAQVGVNEFGCCLDGTSYGKITFEFSNCEVMYENGDENGTNVDSGQIPQILFRSE
jgi:hypothetical protein